MSIEPMHSNVGISTYLQVEYGFLVEKELKSFDSVINNPEHPFTDYFRWIKSI